MGISYTPQGQASVKYPIGVSKTQAFLYSTEANGS